MIPARPNRLQIKGQETLSEFSRLWDRFLSRRESKEQEGSVGLAFAVIRGFEKLSSDLYRARALLPATDPFRRRLEEFAARVFHESMTVSVDPAESQEGAYSKWLRRYRSIWRRNFALFAFTALLFLGSGFVGWNIGAHRPAFAEALISRPMIESILEGHRWFDRIQSGPFFHGMLIAINNIKVSINIFLLGAVLGIGGMLLLGYNGLNIGAVLGFCASNHFDGPLVGFVVGHGPLELTIVIASAFSSFLLGREFYRRDFKTLPSRLAKATSDAACVLAGILPWLLVAASIEAFVSPWDYLDFNQKMLLGLAVASLFWIWTLWPSPEIKK